jgi:hypothetical protein
MWYHRGQVIPWNVCVTMVILEPNAEQCLHTDPELHCALILLNITVSSVAIHVWYSKTSFFNILPCQGVALLIPLQLLALWEKTVHIIQPSFKFYSHIWGETLCATAFK